MTQTVVLPADDAVSRVKVSKKDVYQIVTDRICEQIESGKLNWKKSWSLKDMPKNYVSGKQYRGINTLLLWAERRSSPYWMTYNQAAAAGGNVKKGEKSSLVVFYKPRVVKETDRSTGEEKTKTIGYLLRYYRVFNWEQTEGVPEKLAEPGNQNEQVRDCEQIIRSLMQHDLRVEHGNPAYVPKKDCLQMPNLNEFRSSPHYYSAFHHELTHWTGHPSRVGRDSILRYLESKTLEFGDEQYSQEELVAELGAAFMNSLTGIECDETDQNSAAYLQGWMSKLKSDPALIVRAAGQAQSAVDWILEHAKVEVTA